MAEGRIKLMGRLEYWLGLLYGGLVAAYMAGVHIDWSAIALALMFTAAYFVHWAFLLLEEQQKNNQLLKTLEVSKKNVSDPGSCPPSNAEIKPFA